MADVQARTVVRYEMHATVIDADGNEVDFGEFGSRRFWLRAARWNLERRHWGAFGRNLLDFPRYMIGRG